jgi:uncharacterized RDD family membrane protein YckC
VESVEQLPETQPPVVRYATFTRRVRALVWDTAIVLAVFVATVILGDAAGDLPGTGRVAWLVMAAGIFLYEPLFVWRRGATIGHARNHLVVVDARTGEPPGFVRAAARYVVKLLLGLPSFVAMGLTRRHQAVHDMLTHTVVQIAADYDAPADDFHVERADDSLLLPSRTRRVLVIVTYIVGAFVGYGVVLTSIVPGECLRDHLCSDAARLVSDGLTLVWMLANGLLVIAGWRGLLFGGRRQSPLFDDAEFPSAGLPPE